MTGACTGYAAPNARTSDLALEAGLCKSEENDQMEPFDITDEDFFM